MEILNITEQKAETPMTSLPLDTPADQSYNSKAPPGHISDRGRGFLARITTEYFARVTVSSASRSLFRVTVLTLLFCGILHSCSAAHAAPAPDRPPIPGATNPLVTQLNTQSTICKPGWTATIRPNSSFTQKLKLELIKDLDDKVPGHYELDHNISLQLGGDPVSDQNLWLQHYSEPCGARQKDVIETKLKRLVCSGQLTLMQAQVLITHDWVAAYSKYVRPLSCPGDRPARKQ